MLWFKPRLKPRREEGLFPHIYSRHGKDGRGMSFILFDCLPTPDDDPGCYFGHISCRLFWSSLLAPQSCCLQLPSPCLEMPQMVLKGMGGVTFGLSLLGWWKWEKEVSDMGLGFPFFTQPINTPVQSRGVKLVCFGAYLVHVFLAHRVKCTVKWICCSFMFFLGDNHTWKFAM